MTDFTIGTIYLNVRNLEIMLAFYQDIIGLQLHQRNGQTAHLGVGAEDLIVLTETSDYRRNRQTTGLFHLAVLVPDRLQLAKSLRRIAQMQTPLQGMSDHVVSEAIYLADPEGNGIEIYRDRPRNAWYKDGEFQLATLPLDVDAVMSSLTQSDKAWDGLPTGTIMGHIHLHVAAILQSQAFYHSILGMDVMANMGSATFMSYDGYHHHLGANIWGGRQIRTSEELGLEKYELHIHDDQRLQTILSALDGNGVAIIEDDNRYTIYDPSHNKIVIRS